MTETLSTNMPPPRNNCLCADNFLSQKWPHILAALSVITLLGAIFTLLAAYKLVPPESNLVSNYAWSKTLGFGFMAVGILAGIVAILSRLCPPNRRPSHIEVEINESATVPFTLGEKIVLIPSSLYLALDTWLKKVPDKSEESLKRATIIDSIINCYVKKEETLFLSSLTLPDVFAHLDHIKDLTLACCSHSSIFEAPFYKLTNLEFLNIRNLKLADDDKTAYDWSPLFNQLSHLESLHSLTLMSTSITKLPDSIKLENLTRLILTGNSLTKLPPSFSNLRHLETLYLSHNKFDALPDWLFELPAIRIIDAIENLFAPEIVTSLCEKVKPLIKSKKILAFSASNPSHEVNAYTLLKEVYPTD